MRSVGSRNNGYGRAAHVALTAVVHKRREAPEGASLSCVGPKRDQSRGPAARIASLAPASYFLKLSTKNFASFLAAAS